MPFAGELIQVREDEKDWEGAAERLLRNFGLSLLVPDRHYARVADWVDRTHLRGRLVYFRVRTWSHAARRPCIRIRWPTSLRSSRIRRSTAGSNTRSPTVSTWHVAHPGTVPAKARPSRGPGRSKAAMSATRRTTVTGWTTAAAMCSAGATKPKSPHRKPGQDPGGSRLSGIGSHIADLQGKLRKLRERSETLNRLDGYQDFHDIDWQPVAADIARLRRRNAASNRLLTS